MRLGNIFIYTQLICLAFQNLVDILTGLKQLLTLIQGKIVTVYVHHGFG